VVNVGVYRLGFEQPERDEKHREADGDGDNEPERPNAHDRGDAVENAETILVDDDDVLVISPLAASSSLVE